VLPDGCRCFLRLRPDCQVTAGEHPSFAAASAAAPSADASPTLNLAGAYKSLDPKTVMLTVDKKDVTWETLFCYINNSIEELQGHGVQVTSWSGIYLDETTFEDYVLSAAVKRSSQMPPLHSAPPMKRRSR
jgi:hypothetical protein